jgi:hypothetical protein
MSELPLTDADRSCRCPLLNRDIAEGLCMDINLQRIGMFNSSDLTDLRKETGLTLEEVNAVCDTCPHLPLGPG